MDWMDGLDGCVDEWMYIWMSHILDIFSWEGKKRGSSNFSSVGTLFVFFEGERFWWRTLLFFNHSYTSTFTHTFIRNFNYISDTTH